MAAIPLKSTAGRVRYVDGTEREPSATKAGIAILRPCQLPGASNFGFVSFLLA